MTKLTARVFEGDKGLHIVELPDGRALTYPSATAALRGLIDYAEINGWAIESMIPGVAGEGAVVTIARHEVTS